MKQTCPICHTKTETSFIPTSSKGDWRMYVCSSCGTHFQYPNQQSQELYNDAYFEGSTDHLVDYSTISALEKAQSRYKIPYLFSLYKKLHPEKQNQQLRFLDVGPGNGSILVTAQKYGEAYAFDITQANEQILRKNGFTGKFTIVDLEQHHPKIKKDYFDMIHISEVVEHLSQPDIFIKNIAALLKKGGIVFIQTGRADSFSAKKAKESWEYYRLVHSIIYSRKSLEMLLTQHNLEVIIFQRDFETIPQALNVFLKSKHVGYIVTYFLAKIIKDFGRMQIIAIKK